MARKIKIATVCMAGMGSAFIFKSGVEEVASKLGYQVDVEVVDAGSAAGLNVDIYVTTPLMAKSLPPGKPVVAVKSFTNKAEMEEKLGPALRQVMEG